MKTIIEAVELKVVNSIDLINDLGNLIEMNHEFINPIINQILITLNKIIINKNLDDAIRNSALYIL